MKKNLHTKGEQSGGTQSCPFNRQPTTHTHLNHKTQNKSTLFANIKMFALFLFFFSFSTLSASPIICDSAPTEEISENADDNCAWFTVNNTTDCTVDVFCQMTDGSYVFEVSLLAGQSVTQQNIPIGVTAVASIDGTIVASEYIAGCFVYTLNANSGCVPAQDTNTCAWTTVENVTDCQVDIFTLLQSGTYVFQTSVQAGQSATVQDLPVGATAVASINGTTITSVYLEGCFIYNLHVNTGCAPDCSDAVVSCFYNVNGNGDVNACNPSLCAGESLIIGVINSSSVATTYHWTGPNGFTFDSQAFQMYDLQANQSGNYTVTATYNNGCTATATQNVTVTGGIINAGSFGSQNSADICNANSYDSPVITPSAATCDGGNPSYQWQRLIPGNSWTNISGATNGGYNPPNQTIGTKLYRRKATCPCSSSASLTGNYTINVYNPKPGTISGNQSSCGTYDPTAITNITQASNGKGTPTYSWQKKTTGAWTNINGPTGVNYNPTSINQTTQYRRLVKYSQVCTQTKISNVITKTVTSQSPGTTCNDNNANTVNDVILADGCSCAGTVEPCTINAGSFGSQNSADICNANSYDSPVITPSAATCDGGNPSYQWQRLIPGNSWTNISGATNGGYNPPNQTIGTKLYRRKAACPCSSSASLTGNYTINVYNPKPGTISGNQSSCGTYDPTTITNTTQASNGKGTPTYSWQKKTTGAWTNINGPTGVNYNPTSINQTTRYRRLVKYSQVCTQTKISNVITKTVTSQSPGTTCNDNNANTVNDVILADGCSCAGTFDSCATAGGDSDNDGVCNDDDCRPNDPNFPTTPGTTCNDNNANTVNDVILADGCSCAGDIQNTPSDCENIDISVDGENISITGLDSAPIASVQVFNTAWQQVFTCFNDCGSSSNIPTGIGTYFVYVKFYTAGYRLICEENQTVEVTGGCDNVTDGGIIIGDQTVCANDAVATITNHTSPSGGSGGIQYLWLSSTSSCPTSLSQSVAGANQSEYNPGVLTQTTFFVRCSRRAGCTSWIVGESNCVKVTIDNDCDDGGGNGGGGNGIDLALSVTGTGENVSAYSPFSTTFTIVNEGAQGASNVVVNIPQPQGVVFQGGNAFTATQGDYNFYSTFNWSVGSLAPGQNATITLNYYSIAVGPYTVYGQVSSMTGNDTDSTPGNGTAPTVNEDDEAVYNTDGTTGGGNGGGGSPTCTLTLNAAVSNIVCDDNGTPTDANDDTFTFSVTATGGNPWGWSGGGQSGSYGQAKSYGPYSITTGNVNFTITDMDNQTCTTEVSVNPPSTCSDGHPGDDDGDCGDIVINATGSGITITAPDTAPLTAIWVFDASWQTVFNCSYGCNETENVTIGAGTYHVIVKRMSADWTVLCEVSETVSVQGLTDNGADLRNDDTATESKDIKLSTYPNPANDVVNIRLSSEIGDNVQIIMTDAVGRPVYQSTVSHPSSTYQVNTSDFSAGIYYLGIIANSPEKVK